MRSNFRNLTTTSTLLLLTVCSMAAAQQPARRQPPASLVPTLGVPAPPAEKLAPESNPAVEAALELPRTKPSHYLSAVLTLADLKRPELAIPILQELMAIDLSDEQRAALVAEFGSHRMLQLSQNQALAPAGQEFAEACMASAAVLARDPNRIAELIQQLYDPNAGVRMGAMNDLASAGRDGVVSVLEAMAAEQNPQRRTALGATVAQMDAGAVGPLLGMLWTNDSALRAEVVRLLQVLNVNMALPLIADQSPVSTASAEKMLDDAICRYERGTQVFVPDANGEVELWQWDDATKKLSTAKYPADEAKIIWSARLAMKLAELRPDSRDYQCQALALGLEAAALTGGPNSPFSKPLENLLATSDGRLLSAVLNESMKQNFARGAEAAADLIGRRGDVSAVTESMPNPSALVQALEYPNRRVRFAALRAIMALNPQSSFPGASRVPETLNYFTTSANERRAVVAMPGSDMATTLAGRLSHAGVDADAATNGGAAVRMSTRSADLELILVDMDIDSPGVRDVLYALRTNAATGHTPIGLLATSTRFNAAQNLAAEHHHVVAYPRPQNDDGLAQLVTQLRAISDRNADTPDERAQMAAQALDWYGALLSKNNSFYDLRRGAAVIEAALYQPEEAQRAVAVLALLGTPASQRALVDFASRQSVSIDARQSAARAFQKSVERYGILLTEEEILRQYDRYNASATADADTQHVLGALLDTLESLRAKAETRVN
jgi:CheY-like chemotaxis protein